MEVYDKEEVRIAKNPYLQGGKGWERDTAPGQGKQTPFFKEEK